MNDITHERHKWRKREITKQRINYIKNQRQEHNKERKKERTRRTSTNVNNDVKHDIQKQESNIQITNETKT